ncbi:hypothetical protein AALB47_20195 [Lachnospiraceae bacterium 54-11]
MVAIGSRESVIQNLEDAGCETGMIQDFLGLIKDSRQSSWNCWNIRENICLAEYTRMKEGFPVWII